ncbi:unnamed protein product [Polarella glacialis]|uniref:Uncharacterized protein n=1 Tax=Polarella glacialis TaxID=89957 RepID=A0A813I155_POLGL|nr:unnamed protein product [Polarella glacialis]CAE8651748.1 unnamed protein product [Polarella glacialis]
MGSSSSIEVKVDRSTTKFAQVAPLDVQEPPRPKKAKRASAWQRSKIFLTRRKVAASPVQKAAWNDHDQSKQNGQNEQKEVDEEQEGIEADLSFRLLSKATMGAMVRTNCGGSELGHDECYECSDQCRMGTPPPTPPLSGPPREPDAKTSQQRKAKVPREGDVLSLEERNMFHNMKIVPEPLGLLNFNSYKFKPTRADLKAGHPIPPCSPTHKNYIKHLRKNLLAFEKFPLAFQDLAFCRRKKFDKMVQRDGNIAHMREEFRQEILAAEAKKGNGAQTAA